MTQNPENTKLSDPLIHDPIAKAFKNQQLS